MLNLKQIESTLETMFVFISDVWLDSPKVFYSNPSFFPFFNKILSNKVMEKLHTIFSGYSDTPPYAFVMCGNFLSEPKYGLRCDDFSECFKKLADLICQFSLIKTNSHFIFIPGPNDPGVVKVFPR